MKKIIGLILSTLIIYVFLIPQTIYAKPVDQNGMGLKNDFNYASESAFEGLPDDSELEEEVNEATKDISVIKQGKAKNIKQGKEGLYKTYEEEFKALYKQNKKVSKETADYVNDIAKKYNTSTNQIEAGKFDFNDHALNLFIKLGSGGLNLVTKPLGTFTLKPSEILDSPSATPLKNAFDSLTDSLIIVFIIFQVLKIIVLKATDIGNYSNAIYEKVAKTIIALVIIALYDPLFKLVLNIQYLLITPILKSITIDNQLGSIIMLKTLIVSPDSIIIAVPVLGLLMLVVTLSLFFSLAYLIILYVTGPLAISTMVNEEMNFYSLWVRKLVARVLTVFLQSLCIALSLSTLFRVTFDPQKSGTDILLSGAFLLVALSIPKILENFGDSSGTGRTTVMAVRSFVSKK